MPLLVNPKRHPPGTGKQEPFYNKSWFKRSDSAQGIKINRKFSTFKQKKSAPHLWNSSKLKTNFCSHKQNGLSQPNQFKFLLRHLPDCLVKNCGVFHTDINIFGVKWLTIEASSEKDVRQYDQEHANLTYLSVLTFLCRFFLFFRFFFSRFFCRFLSLRSSFSLSLCCWNRE